MSYHPGLDDLIFWSCLQSFSVADLPYPKEGASTYYLTNFARKLYENEEILAQMGEGGEGTRPYYPCTNQILHAMQKSVLTGA